ncbi:hypothetical protein RF11_00625 [Thelohanellus kitauei]|uniref:Uncharacterized protein n=1 Tax=Thelohanellus kitauei TaxID=669202 RepID=A0A0C2MS28_THEKT|nr:hypothetical protein RF11_00625 [Thelohanellus kitauei]
MIEHTHLLTYIVSIHRTARKVFPVYPSPATHACCSLLTCRELDPIRFRVEVNVLTIKYVMEDLELLPYNEQDGFLSNVLELLDWVCVNMCRQFFEVPFIYSIS